MQTEYKLEIAEGLHEHSAIHNTLREQQAALKRTLGIEYLLNHSTVRFVKTDTVNDTVRRQQKE